MSVEDDIKWIAERCAARGLKLRDAKLLFDALHMADCIAATKKKGDAAKLAGMDRGAFLKMRRRIEERGEKNEQD